MSVSKIILLGNLGKPFEVKTTKDGKVWATASLAVNTKHKGDKVTTWFKLKAFGKTAETLGQYCEKGQSLYIEGTPQAEAWLPNGSVTPMCQITVMVDTFQFIGGRAQETTPKDDAAIAANATRDTDELPRAPAEESW